MLASHVLYFPTIRLPPSAWLSRVLLYWEGVTTITPSEFIEEPDKHDPYTLRLIRAGLVTQVIPAYVLHGVGRFTDSFMEYLENLGPVLERRRTSFCDSPGFRIHLEKLNETAEELERIKLARFSGRYPWVEVERSTAQDFMAYLAAVLGRFGELASMPITDDPGWLGSFITASSPTAGDLEALRTDVISEILPAPNEALDPDEIQQFKDGHANELRRFRNRVEQKLVELATIQEESLRTRAVDLFIEEARQEIDDLRREMVALGWVRTTLTKVSSVVPSIPGVQPLVGLAASVIAAFTGDANIDRRSPFLYAAEAQELVRN